MLTIVSGDFATGWPPRLLDGKLVIGFNRYVLAPSDVASWEIVSDATFNTRSTTGRIASGALGAFFLGPVGLLAGVGNKTNRETLFAITFRDGKRALIKADTKSHDELIGFLFSAPRDGRALPNPPTVIEPEAVPEPLPERYEASIQEALSAQRVEPRHPTNISSASHVFGRRRPSGEPASET